jgi:hypothetical protein
MLLKKLVLGSKNYLGTQQSHIRYILLSIYKYKYIYHNRRIMYVITSYPGYIDL